MFKCCILCLLVSRQCQLSSVSCLANKRSQMASREKSLSLDVPYPFTHTQSHSTSKLEPRPKPCRSRSHEQLTNEEIIKMLTSGKLLTLPFIHNTYYVEIFVC